MTIITPARASIAAFVLSLSAFTASPIAAVAQEGDAVTQAPDTASQAHTAAQSLIASLTAIGSDQTLDEAERREQLRQVLSASLATGPMNRFALGPSRRAESSETQIAQYEELFPDYIAVIFSTHIQRLAERPLEVRDAVQIRDNEAIVQTFVFDDQDREAAQIDWRYRISEDGVFLLDVIVEGISRMVALRAEFGELIDENGGIDGLLSHMSAVVDGVETVRIGEDLEEVSQD